MSMGRGLIRPFLDLARIDPKSRAKSWRSTNSPRIVLQAKIHPAQAVLKKLIPTAFLRNYVLDTSDPTGGRTNQW